MPATIIRGDECISLEDLKAHLAALLRLENVGIFLGSGASVGSGGKTVAQLWSNFLQDYQDSANSFAAEGFIHADDAVLANFEEDPPRIAPNLETLLDALEIAKIDWERRSPTSRNLKSFKRQISNLVRSVIRAAILSKDRWLDPYHRLTSLDSHIKLLQRTIGARQPGQPSPWLFTTNYDLAVEWAAESVGIHVHTGFLGIHNRSFSPQSFDLGFQNTHARGEARFGCNDVYLAKLHGSLTWRRHADMDYRELAATEAWAELKAVVDGKDEPDDSIMVFPRAAKYMQTVGYLSGELFRRFSDFLARPQTCLLIYGYSFGDEHLNRLIRSALLNPTLQVVVFLPELGGDSPEDIGRQNDSVKDLLSLGSPRLTFVGGGEAVYFNRAVELLPDPILYDLTEREMRDRLRNGNEGDAE